MTMFVLGIWLGIGAASTAWRMMDRRLGIVWDAIPLSILFGPVMLALNLFEVINHRREKKRAAGRRALEDRNG